MEKPTNRMGWNLNCMADVLMVYHRSWWANPLPLFNRATLTLHCLLSYPKKSSYKTPFSRSGWSIVRSVSLAKGGTSKKRPSPHLHKVPNRSHKVSLRPLQTALVCVCVCVK
jgi:hypothetical protein